MLQYSCCNEDADSELTALTPKGRKVVAVAASGGRAFSLLAEDPCHVTAIDVNPAQIHLSWLNYHAIRLLRRREYLAFVGILPAGDRLETYRLLRPYLPSDAKAYWDCNSAQIERGTIAVGRYEQSVRSVSRLLNYVMPQAVSMLRACNTIEDQNRLFCKTWLNLSLRMLFKAVFNPVAGKYLIRDRSFYGRPRRAGPEYLLSRLRTSLRHRLANECFVLDMFVHGGLREGGALPVYMEEGTYDIVRRRLDRLVFTCADLLSYLRRTKDDTFGAFSLSDLGSYIDANELTHVLVEVARTGHIGAKVCLREFIRQPRLHAQWPERICRDYLLEEVLGASDRSVGYTFICGEIVK